MEQVFYISFLYHIVAKNTLRPQHQAPGLRHKLPHISDNTKANIGLHPYKVVIIRVSEHCQRSKTSIFAECKSHRNWECSLIMTKAGMELVACNRQSR